MALPVWIWACVPLLILGPDASVAQNPPPEVDLCSQRPGYHPNGEHLEYAGLSTQVSVSSASLRARCLMRLSTCGGCRLSLRPNSTWQFPHCPHPLQHDPGYCAPGCTYLVLYDQDYRNQTERSYNRSSWGPTEFFSESNTVYAIFCSNQSSVQNIDVKLELSSIEKTSIIRGSAYDHDQHSHIASPMFPGNYAENDETYTYKFEATNPNEVIQLIFDDWDLSRKSEIWFDNSNMDGRVMYNSSRPYVVSRGDTLHMTFKTGTQSTPGSLHNAQGFRATYRFLSSPSQALEANTACGLRIRDSTGGIIKFDQLKDPHDYYDCVWVLEPFPDFNGTYVKLITYQGTSATSGGNSVEIRQGTTSVGDLQVTVYPSTFDHADINGYNSPTGFYIRLRGRYSDPNDFVVAYASYATGETKPGMFRCDNMKNIPFKLRCDRYDHCGDNSDERSSLCDSGYNWQQHYSYTISTGVIIPMVISIFLIIVICLLIIFIRRCRQLSQQNAAQHRSQIPTVSGATSRRQRRRNRDRSSSHHGNEAPPSYDDVIRTTPVGYLNLAFTWGQGDGTMVQPPSYEEATSPTGLGPGGGERLGTSLNVSSSSSSSGQPGYPPHPGLQYSSSSLESSRPRNASDTTSPSQSSLDSLLPQQQNNQGRHGGGGNTEGTRTHEMPRPSRPPGKVEDEFISPVSTSTLRNKGEKQDEVNASGDPNPFLVEVPSPGAGCQDASGRVPATVPEPPAVAESVIMIHEEPRAELEAQGVRFSVPPNQHRRAASHGVESGPQVTLPQPPQQTQSLGRSSNFPPHQREENRRNPRDDHREAGDGTRPPPYQQDPRGRNGGGDRPREPGPPRPRPPSREPPRDRERREGERRGDRKDGDRREGDRRDGDRRVDDRRDRGKREGDRRDPDRREGDRRDPDRRDPDRRDPERRDPDRREGDRRDPDRREGDRRDPDRRDPERRDPDRREGDRRDPDRRDPDRRDPDRRERPRNSRPPPPGLGSLERSQPGPHNREGHSRPPPRPQSEPRHNRRPPPRDNSNPRSPSRGDAPRHPPPHHQRGQGRRGSDEREYRERGQDQERSQGGRGRGDDRNPRPRNDQPRGGGSRPADDRGRDPGRGRDQDRGQRPPERVPPPRDVRVNMDEAQSSQAVPDSSLVVSNSGLALSLHRGDGPENDDIFV